MRLIANKRFHRTKAGQAFSIHAAVGRALIALGYARLPDAPVPPKKTLTLPKDKKAEQHASTYQRRDMTAEPRPAPVAQPAMGGYWTKQDDEKK